MSMCFLPVNPILNVNECEFYYDFYDLINYTINKKITKANQVPFENI